MDISIRKYEIDQLATKLAVARFNLRRVEGDIALTRVLEELLDGVARNAPHFEVFELLDGVSAIRTDAAGSFQWVGYDTPARGDLPPKEQVLLLCIAVRKIHGV